MKQEPLRQLAKELGEVTPTFHRSNMANAPPVPKW